MSSRGFLIVTAITFTALLLFWNFQSRILNSGYETAMFDRIDEVIANGEPSADHIVDTFDLPDKCRSTGCFFNRNPLTDEPLDRGSLSSNDEGLIFVMEGLGEDCIRLGRVEAKFGPGEIEESCFDAACWYYGTQHEWGILSFELEKPTSRCVSSVVINSKAQHRSG